MAENTFRSPGFFENEIDLSAVTQKALVGTPAGVIGTSNKGPAFVPVSVANFDEFKTVFGDLDQRHYGTYASNEFLKHRTALTYMRVLGAGANTSGGEIATSQANGTDKNAGFYLYGNSAPHDNLGRHNGAVQFLVGLHTVQANEAFGMPMFTDNNSFGGSTAKIVRGMVMMASGARMMVLNGNESAVGAFTSTTPDDGATISSGKFKLIISSTLGNEFYNADGNSGVRIFTASMDPSDPDYFAKLLNTDPDKFEQEQHYLYADFAVDDEVATATRIGILSGTNLVSSNNPAVTTMREVFGSFNTRFKTPASTWFISQPFGSTEHNLFKFEALDDGEFANKLYKISITSLKASLDDANPYGSFAVQIRDWNDTDTSPVVLETFQNCSLDPTSPQYVAKLIGDRKVFYNFDAVYETERRIIASGKYNNVSKYVRIVMADDVERAIVPKTSLPFGFRGHESLNTNSLLTDSAVLTPASARISGRLQGSDLPLSSSILPPVPFRYKVTRGQIPTTAQWPGQPGSTEAASVQLYWGVKFERNTLPLNSNLSSEKNELMSSYSKMLGIAKLDATLDGADADTFNNNKFTLSKVALSNQSISDLTASVSTHMREAAYVRNANLNFTDYTLNDGVLTNRLTLASLLTEADAATFNRFSPYAKFTNFLFGGWDGTNLLDRDSRRQNDKASSFDFPGGAEANYVAPGMLVNPSGVGQDNNTVVSYQTAVRVMTDRLTTNINLLAIPGIRESFITDAAMSAVQDYGLAMYVMDIASYDDDQGRLFDNSSGRPSVEQSVNVFDTRGIDNNYVATYFPDVFVNDETNKRRVRVPSSVAVLGAIAFNDRVGYPWFAPAGFNRAALDFVTNTTVRLNSTDRDRLYDSRINPIATFPRLGFVIYGQKTLQVNKSALDRVNVRRLLLEVKRVIIGIAQKLVFEQNNAETRNKFVAEATLSLGFVQAQAGVEQFRVIMNESNNSQEDIDLNRMNGRIVIVPTRTIEYIELSYIITNSGVQFV